MTPLRQLVLAAREPEPAVRDLRELFACDAIGPPYRDPGVGAIGLVNAVPANGCDFVEVVSPEAEGTAAGRWTDRHGGDGGYLQMVDGPPSLVDRQRLSALDLRVVHESVHPDITHLHLHPKDVGGVLLALDTVDPPGSGRWGGAAWTGTAATARGALRSLRIAVDDPQAVARRWAAVLDLPDPEGGAQLALDVEPLEIDPREGSA